MRSWKLVILALFFLLIALGLVGYRWLFAGLPFGDASGLSDPAVLASRLAPPSVRITDRNGRLLYELLPEDGGRHAVVPLGEIPQTLRQATLATEDVHFYRNPGVDLTGILRAVWINLRHGQMISGGSTITQQVARNLLLSADERAERSVRRKLREIYLAWQLTRHLSKDDILALYLNQTYYGAMAYGVEAAAQTYFGKPVAQLDLAEAALLAGLPQAPARYNPFSDLPAARERQSVVLSLMEKAGFITAEQRAMAEKEPLALASTPYPMQAPHFVMMVRARLDGLFTPETIYQHGGLIVRTSLDLDWQAHAEEAVARQMEALRQADNGLGHNVNNAALVAINPQTGEILALVGSPDYFDQAHAGAINMALAPRQPGSALKPLVYAVAFDPTRPQPWTAATMLLDVHTSFVTHDGRAYMPENYDRMEHGPVLAREALASSLNIPAVLTLNHIGLADLFELANRLGISTLDDPERYDLTLALGGGEVRLLDLTSAYGAFANGGYRVTPHSILEVRDLQGNLLYTAPPMSQVRVLDERVAWLISDILSDDDARRRGFGPNTLLNLDRPTAVKTGTTSNFHDNWTVGYTPSLVVGVWVGNTSYEPMREINGLSGAAPIWHQFMRTVLAGRPAEEFHRPQGLVQVQVCALSGLLPTPDCPYRRFEWFINGTQPTEKDHLYHTVWIDSATGLPADAQTPVERRVKQLALDLPAQAEPWARSQGLLLWSDWLAREGVVVSQRGDATDGNGGLPAAQGESASLQLISPPAGGLYRLAEGYDLSAQRLRIEAVGQADLRRLRLFVDGQVIAELSSAPYVAYWPLSPGKHTAWADAILADGQRLSSEKVTFEVH